MFTLEDRACRGLFVRYILFSVVVFALLTIIHSWITYDQVNLVNFIVPVFAGMIVGFLMARNKILRIQLTVLANTDKLTGAYNRQYFDQRLSEETDRAIRYKHGFCIIYLDLDFFKKVNDQYGHGVGDKVLIDFAKIVKSAYRESDIFARFGGEEFIILAQMTDRESAMCLYQRIKQATLKHTFVSAGKITFSAGIAEFNIEGDSVSNLLERADQALYKAKEAGRNQAIVAD